jgi:RNA polymerase sigma factor (sigma-70 family)
MALWQDRIVSLITKERERWIGYVRRLIDDAAERDGEDIVQDVIVNLFDRADITDPVENLTAYVYRALRNRIIDYLRKKRETVSLDGGWPDEEAPTLFDVLPEPPAGDLDEASRLDIRRNLAMAFSVLTEEQKAVLIATEMEGRTFRELSEEWGVPLGTLLARKSRAIKKIKDTFSGFNQ